MSVFCQEKTCLGKNIPQVVKIPASCHCSQSDTDFESSLANTCKYQNEPKWVVAVPKSQYKQIKEAPKTTKRIQNMLTASCSCMCLASALRMTAYLEKFGVFASPNCPGSGSPRPWIAWIDVMTGVMRCDQVRLQLVSFGSLSFPGPGGYTAFRCYCTT